MAALRLRCYSWTVLSAAFVAAALLAAPSGQVAYSSSNGDLLLAKADGSGEQVLFTSDGSSSLQALAIAPDGRNVLALSSGDTQQLVLVPVSGGAKPVPIAGTADADAGSISPDGKTVVFTSVDGLFTVAVGGGTPKKLAATPDDSSDSLPQYSPDGKQIAFARDTLAGNGDETVTLELMPVAGGSPKPLATGLVGSLGQGGRIAFSPDGTMLAYAGDPSDPGIFAVATSGGGPKQLTSDLDSWPTFSSDGSTVLFTRDASSDNSDGNSADPVDPVDLDVYELWMVGKDGAGETAIAEGDYETLASQQVAAVGGTTPPAAVTASVTKKGKRYVVRWTGTATSWKIVLTVGKAKATATVAGSVHVRTFTLKSAKGVPKATVTAAS